MPTTFAGNENNDLYIGPDGNLAIFTGIEAVLNNCATAAKAQLGEMIFAVDQGIPNFQTIWVGNPNIPQFESALRTTLLGVDGVIEILDLDVQISNNILTYIAVINTIYGRGTFSGGL
jgi:hypothetical protein